MKRARTGCGARSSPLWPREERPKRLADADEAEDVADHRQHQDRSAEGHDVTEGKMDGAVDDHLHVSPAADGCRKWGHHVGAWRAWLCARSRAKRWDAAACAHWSLRRSPRCQTYNAKS